MTSLLRVTNSISYCVTGPTLFYRVGRMGEGGFQLGGGGGGGGGDRSIFYGLPHMVSKTACIFRIINSRGRRI
jgi:hypothetical protein